MTIDEIEERNELLNDNAFKDWSRREFQQFIKANEKFGRHDLANIAAEISTKTLPQVKIIFFIVLGTFYILEKEDE